MSINQDSAIHVHYGEHIRLTYREFSGTPSLAIHTSDRTIALFNLFIHDGTPDQVQQIADDLAAIAEAFDAHAAALRSEEGVLA